MDPAVIDHEPRVAFDAGGYGMDIFKRLIRGAPEFLRPGGMLAFEIGGGQERMVSRLFRKVEGSYSTIDQVDDGTEIRVLTAIRA
jgi:release factor glutamine methyltransferase